MSQPLTIEHLVSLIDVDEATRRQVLTTVIAGRPWTQVVTFTIRQWTTRLALLDKSKTLDEFDKDLISVWAKWLFAMYHVHAGFHNKLALALTPETCEEFTCLCLGAEMDTGNTFPDVYSWVQLARKTTPEGPLLPILDHIAVFALHL
uniref:Uncharacterized protein n=1 Tax=Grammatophora oceanica TaxID=210454 RepID=A0A7S1V8T9_9STRA|mmetsp:Transcript_39738/g.58959  ORF Transcript_39738/g.58959 Transcript_39738/m.58959 type:complete len:148 (+) Transcript_39738:118-561(+)